MLIHARVHWVCLFSVIMPLVLLAFSFYMRVTCFRSPPVGPNAEVGPFKHEPGRQQALVSATGFGVAKCANTARQGQQQACRDVNALQSQLMKVMETGPVAQKDESAHRT